jgi:hypothetical protein
VQGAPVPPLFKDCSNTDRWGPDDQLGTLNLIGSDVVLRALRTCTEGVVVALGRPIVPQDGEGEQPGSGNSFELKVYSGPERRDALDRQVLSVHGFDVTHLDAVGHSFYKGTGYNGHRMDDIVRPGGLSACGIEAMSGGIVTRAVLLDILRCRGEVPLSPEDGVSAGELDEAERRSGAKVLPGDAVLVRTGLAGWPEPDGRRAGLEASAVRWLHERQVALYGGDCIERLPGDDDFAMVLHQVGHAAMGLAILDNADLGPVRAACDLYGRQSFMLVIAPLPIRGATGTAVNPLAVF